MYMVSEDSGKSNQNVHLDIFYTASSRFNRASVQGPVVQSIVSLTSSLRGQLVKCFTTL